LKVLHVYRTYFPDTQGGLEEVVRQICRTTKPLGVENRVFTLSDNPSPAHLQREEGEVIRVKKTFEIASCGFALTSWREFARQVEWADVVHYQFPWPFADMLHLVAGGSKPSVLTYQSDIVRQRALGWVYRPLMNRFLGDMKRIIATSPNYFDSSEVLQQYADKVTVLPIGLDEESYPPRSALNLEMDAVRNEHGEEFFLFVGVLRYYKGLHLLLEAMKGAPYKVVIAGKGPEEEALKLQARKLGLDNIIFTGYISDAEKMALLHCCRAVVFPSHLRSEAFGVTLLEGAMCGKALISANIGTGTTYINKENETGLVVTPESISELRAAMDSLHADPALALKLGQAARVRYKQLFTGAQMGRGYAGVYEEVLAEHVAKSRDG
jgi:O-antigen biosynthesis rhamnosyltransferase